MLFSFVLPPIIFAAGYNIRKEFFFKNVVYIGVFGFLATLLNFILLTAMLYGVNSLLKDMLNVTNSKYYWDLMVCMKMSTTLIASDTIAPLTTIDDKAYPQLFSIIFGEGISNDAVALILMNTILGLDTSSDDGTGDDSSKTHFLKKRSYRRKHCANFWIQVCHVICGQYSLWVCDGCCILSYS